jgi:hypothetical protein
VFFLIKWPKFRKLWLIGSIASAPSIGHFFCIGSVGNQLSNTDSRLTKPNSLEMAMFDLVIIVLALVAVFFLLPNVLHFHRKNPRTSPEQRPTSPIFYPRHLHWPRDRH